MEIVMHTFPATNVTPEYTHPAVHVGGFRFEPVYSLDGRPVYVADALRVRNPRGGHMTRIHARYVDEAGGVEALSQTEWRKRAKPFAAA